MQHFKIAYVLELPGFDRLHDTAPFDDVVGSLVCSTQRLETLR
jgi:hypothetical protein